MLNYFLMSGSMVLAKDNKTVVSKTHCVSNIDPEIEIIFLFVLLLLNNSCNSMWPLPCTYHCLNHLPTKKNNNLRNLNCESKIISCFTSC